MKKTLMTIGLLSTFATGATIAANSFTTYTAVCATNHGTSGWFGPSRNTYAAARQDAQAHERTNPGHTADVLSSGQ